jgi:hypothetical protein
MADVSMSSLIVNLQELERCVVAAFSMQEGFRLISAEDDAETDREQLLLEVQQLRRQRDSVRLRLQRILERLDALEEKLLAQRSL